MWLACFAFSLVSAMGFSFGTRARTAAETGAAIEDRQALVAAISRAEREAAALPEHRPVSTVQGDLHRAETVAGRAFALSNGCKDVTGRWQRDACAPVLALRTELAAAKDASTLEARLAGQREKLAAMAIHGSSDAQANVLAWLSAGLIGPEFWRHLMSLFVAAIVEFGAAACLLITVKSVAFLLADEGRGVAPAIQPQTLMLAAVEPQPVAAIAPETGWRLWFEDCVSPQNGARVTPKAAYAHYVAWADRNGVCGVLQYHTFGRRMAEGVTALGGELKNSSGRYYAGVALTEQGGKDAPLLGQLPDREAGN